MIVIIIIVNRIMGKRQIEVGNKDNKYIGNKANKYIIYHPLSHRYVFSI